jgi:apolipoprotein D and lipocalin family protein
MKHISAIFLLLLTIACSQHKPQTNKDMIDNSTVKTLDLNRYLGTWYEIARFPHSFEKDLVGVTATYSLKPNGKIKVVNQGYEKSLDGTLKVAEGKAKIPDKKEPGKFKVSFFWFFYADYFVMELDQKNYDWVMIGSSSPKYFWILSRKPMMDDATYKMLLDNARERGYDLSKLIRVQQKI